MRIKYFVQSEYNGCEIQQIMRREFNMSTTWIKRVKLYGTVDLNGVHAKVKEHVKTGDLLLFEYEDNSGKLTPPDNVSILYETESYAYKPLEKHAPPRHASGQGNFRSSYCRKRRICPQYARYGR